MCEKCDCQNPEKKKDNNEKCTPEQNQECHGDEKNLPCECENK